MSLENRASFTKNMTGDQGRRSFLAALTAFRKKFPRQFPGCARQSPPRYIEKI
jgi:hypothetical protein